MRMHFYKGTRNPNLYMQMRGHLHNGSPESAPRVEHRVLVEIRAESLFICKCDYEPKAVAVQLGSSAIAICSVTHKEQFNLKVNLGCASQCAL